MPLLPVRYGQHTLVHGGAHLQTARWAPCCSWPSHLPEKRCRLAAERQQASAKQTRHPVAWSRSTRRCKRVCSSVAEQAPSWGRAGGSSSRAGAGVRGLLQRLRKSLPSADALALQAGAIRHPKFAPMVFLCVPTLLIEFWCCIPLLLCSSTGECPGKAVLGACRFFSMSFVNTVLDSIGNSLVITAVGGGTEVIPWLTGESWRTLFCSTSTRQTWPAGLTMRCLAAVYAVWPASFVFLVRLERHWRSSCAGF